jgi:hypothetical protein
LCFGFRPTPKVFYRFSPAYYYGDENMMLSSWFVMLQYF